MFKLVAKENCKLDISITKGIAYNVVAKINNMYIIKDDKNQIV